MSLVYKIIKVTVLLECLLYAAILSHQVEGKLGVNWGMITSHRLHARDGVNLIKSYGFHMVKLFTPDPEALHELTNHQDLEIMVACENGVLPVVAQNSSAAIQWLEQNVVPYTNKGTNIRYIAIGNEPFLPSYGNDFIPFVLPALQNINIALNNANISHNIRLTVPLDGYVLRGNLPSEGQFRPDIMRYLRPILKFLNSTSGAFTINLYPFMSVYRDPGFPLEYAFLDSNFSIRDGPHEYHNVFEAQIDKLISSLSHEGLRDLPIIVGEIGWPTYGHEAANIENAQRFNQGLINFLQRNVGTPLHPNLALDVYFFGLVDEDLNQPCQVPLNPIGALQIY